MLPCCAARNSNMGRLPSNRTSALLTTLMLLVVIAVTVSIVSAEAVSGTSRDAEFLSAATKTVHAHDKAVQARMKKSYEGLAPAKNADTSSTTVSKSVDLPLTSTRQTAGGNTSVASQVTTAISQLDLGLGYYKMCPFPFSYLHQCESSSECPGSDCCGMYAFPGPSRWRRSCCVPSSVTTIARVARLCIKSDKRPSVTDEHQPAAVNEVIEHIVVSGDQGKALHVPLAQYQQQKQQTDPKSDTDSKRQPSIGQESSAEEIVLVNPPNVTRPVTIVSEADVIILPNAELEESRINTSGGTTEEVYERIQSSSSNATSDDDLDRVTDETAPSLYFIKGIKKGWSSHTSLLHEGVKHIHKVHDSLQPKLHDLVKAHLKGGAADDVCPVVRIYHKNCGRPCSSHKHCKDPHYACCKVICDDPWDKHSFKKGLYCHRMVEGKWMFDHSDPPQDHGPWGHGDHHGWDAGHTILDMLMKQHKNKAPHHDSLGDKKVFLIG